MGSSSNTERFWLLAGLKLDNEATEAELLELDQLIRDNPELLDRLTHISRLYHFKAYSQWAPDVDKSFSRHIQRLSNRLSSQPNPYETVEPVLPDKQAGAVSGKKRLLLLAVLAGGIAAALLAFFLITGRPGERKGINNIANVITTRYGSKSRVQLPDGTQVWLDADSKLVYGKDFGNQVREVSLSGEAFFDVQKDVEHPFIIHAASLDIKVLGTAFNVRSYRTERNSEATLIRGSIEVTLRSSPEHKILMRPNNRIVVQNKEETGADSAIIHGTPAEVVYQVEKVDTKGNENTSLETVWKKNNLSFRNESLENIAGRIEHWFNVKVGIRDEDLEKMTYSCDFKGESLKQVMEALHLTGGFRYRIVKDSVIIMK